MVRFMLPLTEILYGSFFIIWIVIPLAEMQRDDIFTARLFLFGFSSHLRKCGVMVLFIAASPPAHESAV